MNVKSRNFPARAGVQCKDRKACRSLRLKNVRLLARGLRRGIGRSLQPFFICLEHVMNFNQHFKLFGDRITLIQSQKRELNRRIKFGYAITSGLVPQGGLVELWMFIK